MSARINTKDRTMSLWGQTFGWCVLTAIFAIISEITGEKWPIVFVACFGAFGLVGCFICMVLDEIERRWPRGD